MAKYRDEKFQEFKYEKSAIHILIYCPSKMKGVGEALDELM